VNKVCVVVPTKNEEASIADVIRSIRLGLRETGYRESDIEIIVVDDSTDSTRKIVRALNCIVVPGGGEGLGSAMYRGLKVAAIKDPSIILAVDGDGQVDTKVEIPRFVEFIKRGQADLVVGSRFLDRKLITYKYRWLNRLGVLVLVRILRRFTGLLLTDSHGGLRAMTPQVAHDLEMFGTHTYVQEAIIDAVEKGYEVVEIPSSWLPRKDGKSRVVSSIPQYIFHTLPILFLRSGQQIRILYTFGLLLEVIALVVFGIVVVQEGFSLTMLHRTPALILVALLVITGLQLFFFGFVLQLLKQIKKSTDKTFFQHYLQRRNND